MNSTQNWSGRPGEGARERGRRFEPGEAEECVQPRQHAGKEDVDCCVHYLSQPAFASDANAAQIRYCSTFGELTTKAGIPRGDCRAGSGSQEHLACQTMIRFTG